MHRGSIDEIRLGPREPTEEQIKESAIKIGAIIAHAVEELERQRIMPVMRAKLKIESVTVTSYADTVQFRCQYSDSQEDNSFAKATPSGDCKLQIDNPNLRGKFKPNQTFYVDFTPAES